MPERLHPAHAPDTARTDPDADVPTAGEFTERPQVDLTGVDQLSAAEEVELAMAIEAGVLAQAKLDEGRIDDPVLRDELRQLVQRGSTAKDRFILANLVLVQFWAGRRYRVGGHGGLALDDLVSEGTLGLIRAVQKFDCTQGLKFSTYATPWIRNFMARAVDRNTAATIPYELQRRVQQVTRTAEALREDLQRPATASEIANALGTTTKAVRELQAVSQRAVSLDTTLHADEGLSFADRLPDDGPGPEDVASEAELTSRVSAMLTALSPRARRVLTLRFGLFGGPPHSVNETARALGVDESRVREVLTDALGKLRAAHRAEDLRVFLEAA